MVNPVITCSGAADTRLSGRMFQQTAALLGPTSLRLQSKLHPHPEWNCKLSTFQNATLEQPSTPCTSGSLFVHNISQEIRANCQTFPATWHEPIEAYWLHIMGAYRCTACLLLLVMPTAVNHAYCCTTCLLLLVMSTAAQHACCCLSWT